MGLFDGKKGLVLGVANDRSIAWAIAKTIMEEGGEIGFTSGANSILGDEFTLIGSSGGNSVRCVCL